MSSNTPNYNLNLETGFASQFTQTLKLHYSYITKILSFPNNRLPYIFANETLAKYISWSQKWADLCSDLDINFDFNNTILYLRTQQDIVLRALIDKEYRVYATKANNSQNMKFIQN